MSTSDQGSILLTGASGFIGGACLRSLLRGTAEIHCVNRSGTGPQHDNVIWHAANLCDSGSALRLVQSIRPTRLLHCAWIATPGIYSTALDNLDWLEAGIALLRAFGTYGGERFVGVGTCAEYDWSAKFFAEDSTRLNPSSLYGHCKASMWTAAQACAKAHGFTTAWGRVFLPYGPGDAPERLIPSVISALQNRRVVETTNGTQRRDFVYVDDVADFLTRLLASTHEGAFNVGTGRATSVREVTTALAEALGGLSLIQFGAKPARPDEPAFLVADMAKAQAVLGWRSSVDLAAGLAACIHADQSRQPSTQPGLSLHS